MSGVLTDEIIKSATELFSENGYSKTSIQKIADGCETSQTNVLYHFKTKKILFEACLKRAIAKNRESLESLESDDDFEKLLHLLNTNVNWALSSPQECQLFLLLFYFSSNDENFLEISSKITLAGRKLLKEYLVPFKIKDNFALDDVVLIIQNYIHGVMFNVLATKEKPEITRAYNKNIKNFLLSFIEL